MLGTGLALGLMRAPSVWWPEGACYAADFINNRFMSGGVAIPAASAYSFTRISTRRALTSKGHWQLFGDNMIQRVRETPAGLVFDEPRLLSRWLRDLGEAPSTP